MGILRILAVNTKTCELNVKMSMKRWFYLPLLSLIPCICFGQVSANLRYLFGKSETLTLKEFDQNGIHASLEYHLRLKEKRIEFRPGLGYRFTYGPSSSLGDISSIDFDLGTAVYPFDFGGDCDCPTFSKDGNLVKKGFFLEVIPGVAYQMIKRIEYQSGDPGNLPVKSKNFVWKIGGAAGIDIGISEHFTLTPMLSFTWLSNEEWTSLEEDGISGDLPDYAYLGTGVRITYDSGDKKRRRRN